MGRTDFFLFWEWVHRGKLSSLAVYRIACRAGSDLSDGCLEARTIVSVLSTWNRNIYFYTGCLIITCCVLQDDFWISGQMQTFIWMRTLKACYFSSSFHGHILTTSWANGLRIWIKQKSDTNYFFYCYCLTRDFRNGLDIQEHITQFYVKMMLVRFRRSRVYSLFNL